MPNRVIPKLIKGSRVKKLSDRVYEIDNPEVYKQLGDFPKGAIPYGPIYRPFSKRKLPEEFRNKKEVPFSSAVNQRKGECLEKAVLM